MKKHNNNILYIDDEIGNLTGFKASFTNQYNVFISKNTIEAQKHLENHEIKVILVDYKMPEEDGISFALRIQEEYPFAIKILVTSYTESEIAIMAVNSHSFYDFIPKPWDYKQLNIAIKNAIDKYDLEKYNRELIFNLEKSLQNEKHANLVKDVFLKNISHEVRTPLNAIMGFSELIMLEAECPELKDTIGIIIQSGKKLLQTMQSIVDSSIIFANKLTYNGTNFCLKQAIKDVIHEFYQDDYNSENAEVIFELDNNAFCKNDLKKIKVILKKLIDNAFKFSYTPKKIEIRVEETEKDDLYTIKIANNGIKITKDDYDNIFDSFMNAKNSSTRINEGIGLGLHIAKSYTKFLGGQIWLEESKGLSIFCITIKKTYSQE